MRLTGLAFSCYPVTDITRARAFYEGVLGLRPTMNHQGEGVHWIEYDVGAGTLALGLAPGLKPSADGCCVALEVEDFDSAIAELQAAGAEIHFGPLDTPVCHMAFVRDPDGNSVGLHRCKPAPA